MPNGRSGGFILETADLRRLIGGCPPDELLGYVIDKAPPLVPSTATEILSAITECSHERVAVEEQDHTTFIIHISNEPILRIFVKQDSAMWAGLRARHSFWVSGHPGWMGWLAF